MVIKVFAIEAKEAIHEIGEELKRVEELSLEKSFQVCSLGQGTAWKQTETCLLTYFYRELNRMLQIPSSPLCAFNNLNCTIKYS